MADNKKVKLFGEFPPVSTESWEATIAADLKGADYEKRLVWRTDEGFKVRPYYRAEDLEAIPFLGSEAGEFPYVRGTEKCNDWRIHQTVGVKKPLDANREALAYLGAGCNSIGFCIGDENFSEADLDVLLKGIVLGAIEVVFQGKAAGKVAEMMLPRLEKAKDARISFAVDPIMRNLSLKGEFGCCPDGSKCIGRIAELAKKYADYPNVRVAGVSGHYFHNSGSTIVQELAFTLAAGHEYMVKLMEAGLSADDAAYIIRFSMAVSSNYFMEIAKFRAARLLWANIVERYNPKYDVSRKMFAHAVTSKWNQSVYDPYVNMLRGTTEAMSATIAGVHSLEVLPFDEAFEDPTEFSARIARNVQLLLKYESHFDQVTDPSGGSYYIENLTQSIANEAWKLFVEVENRGGYVAAFKEGFITGAIEASAAAKDKAVATRRISLLGVNQFPNFTEVADKAVSEADVTVEKKDCVCLKPYRGAMPFEQMRLATDRSGKNPVAFMLTCGTLSMARARSQFASNFFACAGIRIQDNTFFASVEDGAKAALASGAEIVVLCAADDDYATLAPEAKKLLGDKAILVVAGAPASQPELEAQGIGNFISVRSNVLETLKMYLTKLGIEK
ncbi:MAG: acyl-CoA mutase large subunit family protein [Rikenellaceae bacterium]|jgi:methylmalonyl-CoA mutase|nr:acyl-CoA mutase large subunit family protein [Rikenellaceae bacterium]